MSVPPQVRDEDWFTRFGAELALRGYDGRQVGEAIATVDDHCRTSGERAPEAFGDPIDYAAAISGRRLALGSLLVHTYLPMLGAVAALMICAGAPLRIDSTPVGIPWRELAFLVFWGVVMIPLAVIQTRRPGLVYGIAFFVALATGNFVMDILGGDLRGAAFHVPAWLAWVFCAALLVLAWWAVRQAVRHRRVDPRTGKDRWEFPRAIWAITPFVVPVICLCEVAVRLARHP